MKTVFDTIEKLRATGSTKEKQAILLAEKGNADLKMFLRMTYEPRINFWINKVDPKLVKGKVPFLDVMSGEPAVQFTDDTVADIYDTIAKRDLTGNAARLWLANLYHDLAEDWEKELLKLLIQRDVQAGISKGTINKVWPGLITDVPYMRCSLPSAVDLASWPWARGVYSQIKADGQYANISHLASGAVTIETRQGSPFPLEYFKDLVAEIQATIPKGMQLHGEMLMLDPQGKIMPREKGNGMFNSLQQGGELEPGYQPVYHAWDMIPVEEAKVKNKYHVAYEVRFKALEGYIGKGLKHLELIEYKLVHSLAEAYAHAKEAMEAGLEGTVAKHPDGPWEDSDGSKNQVKLKLEFCVELKITGFKAGDAKSKNAKTFGSIETESSCGKMKVNVSGIKDKVREEMHNDRDNLIGKIITVKSNGIMTPSEQGGFFSLFLPRFIEIRLDKTEADSLERIKEIQDAAIQLGEIFGKS